MSAEKNDTRALIDIARETVERSKAVVARDNLVYAQGIVEGFEAGVENVHRDGVRDYSGALAMANARIADLEGQLAAVRPMPNSSGTGALGIVVDEAMKDRFCRSFFRVTGAASGAFWGPSDRTRAQVHEALTAALTSAHTVPLERAEPFYWRDDNCKSVLASRDGAAAQNNKTVTPLYAGLPEPAQSGDAGVK